MTASRPLHRPPDKLTLSKGTARQGGCAEEQIAKEREKKDAATRVAELLQERQGAEEDWAAAASGAAAQGAVGHARSGDGGCGAARAQARGIRPRCAPAPRAGRVGTGPGRAAAPLPWPSAPPPVLAASVPHAVVAAPPAPTASTAVAPAPVERRPAAPTPPVAAKRPLWCRWPRQEEPGLLDAADGRQPARRRGWRPADRLARRRSASTASPSARRRTAARPRSSRAASSPTRSSAPAAVSASTRAMRGGCVVVDELLAEPARRDR